ncbi:hypothetical protein HN51_045416 [Arachis hypogaea]
MDNSFLLNHQFCIILGVNKRINQRNIVANVIEKLLKYVIWSNGPETENPSVSNKQCAGKDFVVLVSRLLVVELFLRYNSFEIQVGTSPLGSNITLTSLKRISF